MSSNDFIILRQSTVRRSAGPVRSYESETSVAVESLDVQQLGEVRNDPVVQQVAPVVPMQLIAPLGDAHREEPPSVGTAWGIDAVGAVRSPFTGRGVVVAVLDTGIDASHEAFAGMELIRQDFTGEGNCDCNGHGTHCAGIIFGRPVGAFRFATAIGVQRALIGKVLDRHGRGSSDAVCRAIVWAMENGAHVVSLSLGMDFPGYVKRLTDRGFPTDLATSKALEGYRENTRLFDKLTDYIRARKFCGQDMLIVAASGNESRRKVDRAYTITASPPAAADGVVAVAAVGKVDGALHPFQIADFSNTGANVAAPGVDILSAKAGGCYARLSGTSMAAPHVAGVAALWAETLIKENHNLDADILATRVMGYAQLSLGLTVLDVGAGLVQAPRE